MKEATGEANMTIITVVLIGIVAAVGAILIANILLFSIILLFILWVERLTVLSVRLKMLMELLQI